MVFNPGERVEGYTNFLWVALLSLLWPIVGHDAWRFAAAGWILALTLGLLGILAVGVVAARVFRHRLSWVIAVLWLAFDDAFICYTVFALENALLVVCLLGGLVALSYRFRHWEWALGLSFALTAMTRPDGVLWPATFVLAALTGPAPHPFRRRSGVCTLVRAGDRFVRDPFRGLLRLALPPITATSSPTRFI